MVVKTRCVNGMNAGIDCDVQDMTAINRTSLFLIPVRNI